jgi:hypothetical protein
MSFVGGGAGQYIQETTYKYVGWGAGDHDIIPTRKPNYTCIFIGVGVIIVLLVVLLVVMLLPEQATTTTTPMATDPFDCLAGLDNWQTGWSTSKQDWCCDHKGSGCHSKTTGPPLPFDCDAGFKNWRKGWSPRKKSWCCQHSQRGCAPTIQLPYDCEAGLSNAAAGWSDDKKAWCCRHQSKGCAAAKVCTLWGDPHVIGFDQLDADKSKAYSFYGDGDFWIVKSSRVSIQGRFLGTQYTEGLAATSQIVVSGAFIHGHKIEVGTRDSGVLMVDGKPVLTTFPSSYKGDDFEVVYDANGPWADVTPEGNEKRSVHIHLPLGVKVTVNQWTNYMNVMIEMTPQPGQDGICGNFNGKPADDTTQLIMARIGARVHARDKLLSGEAPIVFTPQMEQMLQHECDATKKAAGASFCTHSTGLPDSDPVVKGCVFDACFGAEVRARSRAKKYR